ncbi:serine hydrolase domain-containing protein [Actinocrispum wychmicini]|uniref:D-alanyl-D-alanine carboxypeptidase n=1 Tax=Actinocrispum wychmicini TaxID=1213861 RepID=A0A4V2S412_9PSEU|nr:serine hydrolase domain-containing protein [Actinocrispum wychmicini]TCO46450.1 D-alanyl-D-alanine carboxypeptidase [Actinocrispum wychmicini]
MNLRRLVSMIAAVSVVGFGAAGPAAASVDPRQAAMDVAVAAGNPGMLAVASDWRGTSGVGDVRTGAKPNPSGRFRIGSVSKTFVATLVLQQVAAGRIGLDEPIGKYLPGLLPYPEPITVRQLLQHRSGLPRDLAPQYTWTSVEELDTERFVHFDETEAIHDSTIQPLLFPPGTSFSYSNTGYNVLARLVEKVTGKRFERLLAEDITGPSHLWDTSLPRDFPLLLNPAAHGYEQAYPAPHGLTDVTAYNLSRYFGAGDMISSAPDLNRFFHALLGGRLLPPNLLAQMKATIPAVGPDGKYQGYDYGLGLMRIPLNAICGQDVAAWGHGGDIPGYNTWSMNTEDGARQITTMANQDLTPPIQAIGRRTLVFINEFCTPMIPQASEALVAPM